jgi:hypothetical protein
MHSVLRIASFCTLLAFGSGLSAAPLNLPVQGEVTEIVTTWKDGVHEQDQLSRVTDPKRIEAALGFMRSLNTGWRKPPRTFSLPQYVARFLRGDSEALVVFVGDNWIGGREGSTTTMKNRRRMTPVQRQQFIDLFGAQ